MNSTARCMASNCGKTERSRGRDLLIEQREQILERENQRLADEQAASIARMDAETGDWERPTRYAPTPSPYPPMSAREVKAARERREAEEAAQREVERPRLEAERQEAERLAQLQEQLKTNATQLARAQRDQIANGTDDEFEIDPATTTGEGVPPSQLVTWHNAQFAAFLKSNPDYYKCEENAKAVTDYIKRNAPGLRLVSEVQLTAAYKRLAQYGLLKQRPAPEPPAERPKHTVITASEPPQPAIASGATFKGRDQNSGEMREFSAWEVDRMSAETYRRTFAVAPTVSALFTAMSDNS